MREELRLKLLPNMPIGDYIIIIKPAAAKMENEDLRQAVSAAARKVRL